MTRTARRRLPPSRPPRGRRGALRAAAAAALCAALGIVAASAREADDSAEFVEALRERGHYDLALEFLDSAPDDPLVSPEFRKRIGYELAVTRLEQARTLASSHERGDAIDAAREALEGFIQDASDPALAAEASVQLAGVIVDDARASIASAVNQPTQARARALEGIRQSFDDARDYYTRAQENFTAAIDVLGAVQPGGSGARERLELRFNLAQARLLAARAQMEEARTYLEEDPQRRKALAAAAEEFAGLYDKYGSSPRSVGVGLYAHLYEGECYLQMGETRLADGCFDVLVNLPAREPSFRRLITLAHAHLAASRIAQDQPELALEEGKEWLGRLEAQQSQTPHALALKYQLGVAASLLATSDEAGDDSRRLLGEARALLGDAARGAGEHQADARLKLAEVNNLLGAGDADAQSFDEAFRVGMDAVGAMRSAQLAAEVGGDEQPSGVDLQGQVAASRADATEALARALALAGEGTPRDKLNEARYWLGYLYWEQQDYLRAAVLGEFIATAHPDDPSAELGAKLAMGSLWRLYEQAKGASDAGATFEYDELKRLSHWVTQHWAGTETADAAFSVLLATAIREDRLAEARQALQSVAPERRGPLAIRLASAEWEQAVREAADAKEPIERERAAQKKAAAAASLQAAVDERRESPGVSSVLATAALYLAQAQLDQGDASGAIELLEDDKLGPLTLVSKKAAAVNRPGYAAEAFRTALRAYVSASPPHTEDASAVMKRLEETVSDRAALTKVYFGLAVALQHQVESLNAAGKTDQAAQVSQAFADFLSRIDDAGEDADWTTRQWMAQMFLNLGEGVADPDAQRRFYERARDGFAAMIEAAEDDPRLPPSPTSVLAARMQLGQAQRRLGEYDAAIDTFCAILEEREAIIDVQKAAAYAYQAWGEAQDAQRLTTAIRGGRPKAGTDENLVWGWSKLASVASRAARAQPKYRDLFFESWLNVATCRYLAGMKAEGDARRRQFASARKTIQVMAQQYSNLGGPERRRDFDVLLKKIQRAEGADPAGLAEFTSEDS